MPPPNSVQALLNADVPDPTDFPTTDLRQVDSSLRCTICGELFDAPISLACGHCFCSMCIREHILRESECPSCRKTAIEAHFRVNPTLEGAVSSWKAARANVLRLSLEDQQRTSTALNSSNDQTPRRFQTPVQNGRKRKRRQASEDSDIICVAGPSNPTESSEIAESSPLQEKSARKASRRRENMEPSSDPREEELEQPNVMVNCPICGMRMEHRLVDRHMDGPECRGSTSAPPVSTTSRRKPALRPKNSSNSKAKDEWSKILGTNPKKGKDKDNSDSDDTQERLPRVSYDVLKDKALKDLLLSQKLPVVGDRNAWITRHRRWVMMYNANLDKATGRKTSSELRAELKKWEENQKGPRHVVEDGPAHEVAHKDHFDELVEEARRNNKSKPLKSVDLCPADVPPKHNITDGTEVVEDSQEEPL